MIIELTEDVKVRVPEGDFYTFKKGKKVNYSSEKRGTTHMVHRFVGYAGNNLFLTHLTVTELRDRPTWI